MFTIQRNKPFWKNKAEWICPSHLPSACIPASVSNCYFSNCISVRPPTQEEIERRKAEREAIEIKAKENTCNYDKCRKQISENRKKYCSDTCRKKYAREQYRIRLKLKQQDEDK